MACGAHGPSRPTKRAGCRKPDGMNRTQADPAAPGWDGMSAGLQGPALDPGTIQFPDGQKSVRVQAPVQRAAGISVEVHLIGVHPGAEEIEVEVGIAGLQRIIGPDHSGDPWRSAVFLCASFRANPMFRPR